MIQYDCPRCKEPMSSPASMAGQREACPACGNTVLVAMSALDSLVQDQATAPSSRQRPPAPPPATSGPADGQLHEIADSECRSFFTKIVGVTHRNPDGSDRQKIIGQCRVGEDLRLVREPKNRYDPNAVAVHRLNGQQLGYIGSDLAAEMADDAEEGVQFGARISDLTGGGLLSKRTRGVNLQIFAVER